VLAFWFISARRLQSIGATTGNRFGRPTQAKLKIMFAFFQVTLLCGTVFQVPYHRVPGYAKLCRALSVFTIDLFGALNLDCFDGYSFHLKLYTMSAFALLLEVGVVASIYVYRQTGEVKARAVAAWSLVITYFLYSSLCATIFQTFQCETVDATEWLATDYSIDCNSDAHRSAYRFAIFMVFAFCLGLPVLYLKLLRDFRPSSTSSGSSFVLDTPLFNMLNAMLPRKAYAAHEHGIMDFFQGSFREEYFYWEVIECLRKLTLTGFAVFFGPGSMMQLGLAIVLTVAYTLALASLNPYKADEGCNSLARTEQVALFLVLLEMAMVKYVVTAEAIPNPAYEAGVDLGLLTVALVLTQLSVAVVGCLAIVKEVSAVPIDGGGNKARSSTADAQPNSAMSSGGAHSNPMLEADDWVVGGIVGTGVGAGAAAGDVAGEGAQAEAGGARQPEAKAGI
jgi:hypothetical protein